MAYDPRQREYEAMAGGDGVYQEGQAPTRTPEQMAQMRSGLPQRQNMGTPMGGGIGEFADNLPPAHRARLMAANGRGGMQGASAASRGQAWGEDFQRWLQNRGQGRRMGQQPQRPGQRRGWQNPENPHYQAPSGPISPGGFPVEQPMPEPTWTRSYGGGMDPITGGGYQAPPQSVDLQAISRNKRAFGGGGSYGYNPYLDPLYGGQ